MTTEAITFELESPESWKRLAHVQVDPSHMERMRTNVAAKLAKSASLPGFRKGKVPVSLILSSYAGQVEQNAIEELIPDAYRAVLDANEDIRPIAEPRVENFKMDDGEPIQFDLIIEVRPEVDLTFEGLAVEKISLIITDERVEQGLTELAERAARWVPVEGRGAKDGDAMRISYVPLNEDGEPETDKAEESYSLELGGEGVLPEFNAALGGLQVGDDTVVEVTYPSDYPNEDLANQVRRIEVKVDDIREKQIPAIDDDLAQSISEYQTLDELRSRVKEDLEQTSKDEATKALNDALVGKMIELNDIPAPPSLGARYLQAMLKDYEAMTRQEMSDDDRRTLAERLQPAAHRAAQRAVLLDTLRRNENIEVADEDVDARIAEMAESRDGSAEELRRQIEASQNMERLRHDIEEEKTLALLESRAEITVVEKNSGESDDDADETKSKE